MNGSLLESAISEQLFCNKGMNPSSAECYGISTASGLQRAAAQGQKIYQIDANNKDQLKNITMSGADMIDDINKTINSGGYVMLPERAVDGVRRTAIYVYMTSILTGTVWEISGGLNGGFFGKLNMIKNFFATTSISSCDGNNTSGETSDHLCKGILNVLADQIISPMFKIARKFLGILEATLGFNDRMDRYADYCGHFTPIVALIVTAILWDIAIYMGAVLAAATATVVFAIAAAVFLGVFIEMLGRFLDDLVIYICSGARNSRIRIKPNV